MNLKNLIPMGIKYAKKQLPGILMAEAVVGLGTAAYLIWKESPKAHDIINACKDELKRDDISEEEAKALK